MKGVGEAFMPVSQEHRETHCIGPVWGLMLALVVLDACGLRATGLSLAPGMLLATVMAVAALLALTAVYTRLRPEPRIAGLSHMAAVTLTFSAVTMVLSYVTVALKRPLIDSYLVSADRALGLDWPAVHTWVLAHPLFRDVLVLGYYTLVSQLILLLVVLNYLGDVARGWELQWLFMTACLGCLIFSALWPAAGAFGHFHAEADSRYVHAFISTRDGSLKVIGAEPVQGIIQFPSLHAALGIVYTYAARGIRYLFPLFVAVNVVLVVATVPVGGHHFADLWAGIALALATIAAVRCVQPGGTGIWTKAIEVKRRVS
jgi:hypothetical protein